MMDKIVALERDLVNPEGRLGEEELFNLIHKAKTLLDYEENIVQLNSKLDTQCLRLPAKFTVVGDTHGQYHDLCKMFKINGYPSGKHTYIFNGDFVDRGDRSVEILTLLLTWKVHLPGNVILLRGNHETRSMNARYGFANEVKEKYSREMLLAFWELFDSLPLAACIEKKVIIMHGGIPRIDGILLKHINEVERRKEPTPRDPILFDLLWADPQKQRGIDHNSHRGGGIVFGPDITRSFLQRNGLDKIVRSHEVRDLGYSHEHDGYLLTVFSAPNYCGFTGNLGAIVNFQSETCDSEIVQFNSALPSKL